MSMVATASEALKSEFSWKRLFIKAVGLGAGFALMFTLLACVGLWYMNRPKLPIPPKPWNKEALKAEFRSVGTSREDNFLFQYVVENNSDIDYRINSMSGVSLGAKSKGYLAMCDDCVSLTILPAFIPAHQKVLVPVELKYKIPGDLKTELNRTTSDNESNVVQSYVERNYTHLEGFVLFDENTRYEIDFPRGWKILKK